MGVDVVADAAESLRKFLDPMAQCEHRLLVVISFDEAYGFENLLRKDSPDTRYTVIRRALKALNHKPLFNGRLQPDNVSAILIQVKNSPSYKSVKSVRRLFRAMHPFSLGLFDRNDGRLRPVIRMVFTLSSQTPQVSLICPPQRPTQRRTFTAYDMWCAGLAPASFRVVRASEEGVY